MLPRRLLHGAPLVPPSGRPCGAAFRGGGRVPPTHAPRPLRRCAAGGEQAEITIECGALFRSGMQGDGQPLYVGGSAGAALRVAGTSIESSAQLEGRGAVLLRAPVPALLVKVHRADVNTDAKRRSPPVCRAAEKTVVQGHSHPAHVSTSVLERQDLSMRMSMRRFTRLTNAFSR